MLYFKVIEQNQIIYVRGNDTEIFKQIKKVSSNPNNLISSIRVITQTEFEQKVGGDLDIYILAR